MKNKQGAHVGMILSFLIFVTFIAFLYSITQPLTNVRQDKLNTLEYLKTELINNFSEDMTLVVVQFEEGELMECSIFESENFNELDGLGVIAKRVELLDGSENEVIVESAVINGEPVIERREQTTEKLKFYYSKEFEIDTEYQCPGLNSLYEKDNYNITFFRTTTPIFDSRIINISEEIINPDEYNKLKNELGLAVDDNFGFIFYNENRIEIVKTQEKDINIDIYSEEIPIQYMSSSDANINPGFLVIKVW